MIDAASDLIRPRAICAELVALCFAVCLLAMSRSDRQSICVVCGGGNMGRERTIEQRTRIPRLIPITVPTSAFMGHLYIRPLLILPSCRNNTGLCWSLVTAYSVCPTTVFLLDIHSYLCCSWYFATLRDKSERAPSDDEALDPHVCTV